MLNTCHPRIFFISPAALVSTIPQLLFYAIYYLQVIYILIQHSVYNYTTASGQYVVAWTIILHINVCRGGMFILPTGFPHSILDTCYTSSSRHHPLEGWYLQQWITTYTLRDRICTIFSSPTLSIFDYFPTHYYYIGLWRTRPNCLTDSSAVGGKQRCGFTSKVSLMPVCVVHISSE